MSESPKFKVGDRVLVKNNSHYPKPRRVIAVNEHLFRTGTYVYYLRGARNSWNNEYKGFLDDELIPEEIWNSPLFKSMKE